MPRRARSIVGGYAYHVLNRANGRLRLFKKAADFAAFEQVIAEAHERVPLRILGYTLMGNHWHFVVWPRQRQNEQVSDFFRWLTVTHSQRWHAHHGTSGMGHVYQGRFKSFPIAADEHLLTVLRYVERNPLRAGLVERAEDWLEQSLSPPARHGGGASPAGRVARAAGPHCGRARQPAPERSGTGGHPPQRRPRPTLRRRRWTAKVTRQLDLGHTFRPRGRPKKRTTSLKQASAHPK